MLAQIEKLKQEREKLTMEYKANQVEYKSEIKRIDRAIRSFERGVSELNGKTKPKRNKTSSEIEIILFDGPLHLTRLLEKLNERGIPMNYQSLSSIMQLYAKANKKFTKVAPATYALIEQENRNSDEIKEQTIVYENSLGGEVYDKQ